MILINYLANYIKFLFASILILGVCIFLNNWQLLVYVLLFLKVDKLLVYA